MQLMEEENDRLRGVQLLRVWRQRRRQSSENIKGVLREFREYLEVPTNAEVLFLFYMGVMEGALGLMVFYLEYLLLLLYRNHHPLRLEPQDCWEIF